MSSTSGYLNDLNKAQREAITHEDGPLLIVAGAGTGKTTVITKRITWLIESNKAKSDEILALTFTEKAAEEMEERVDRLLPYGFIDLWISTFHSFGERILERHGIEIGQGGAKVIDRTSSWLLIRNNLSRFSLKHYRPLGNPTKFIDALVTHISRAKDELITPEDYLNYVRSLRLNADSDELVKNEVLRLEEIANAYHVYEKLKQEAGVLDFGDLISETVRLFRNRPQILNFYRNKFKYILVDEFQDTNIAQYELLKILAEPKNNITIVADDDQSIFKFRGASVSNILQFQKDYPKTKIVALIENYRSPQNILDLSYHFIQQNNPNRLEAKLGGTFSKRMKSKVSGKGLVEHLHLSDLNSEVRAVVDKILQIKTKQKDLSWNSFAILVRANDHAAPFLDGLSFVGIPVQFLANRGLYLKGVVLDIISYLRLLDDYHESSTAYRVLNFPYFEIPTEDLLELTHWASRKAWSLYKTMQNAALLNLNPKTLGKIQRLISFISRHTSLARQKNVREVIYAMLNDTGYLKWLTSEESQNESVDYLNQFMKRVDNFVQTHPEGSVKVFLEEFDAEKEAGEEGPLMFDPNVGPEAVKILTLHSAKGLEFDYVFMVNLVERRFPSMDRREAIELPDALVKEILPQGDIHLEEERRLFYVGMTRAKRGLFFTSADDYGGVRKRKISRFLEYLKLKKSKCPLYKLPLEKITSKNLVTESRSQNLLPQKFSFTQYKAFETCPLQYKYAHILKIPRRGRATFSFGKSIHTTLYKFMSLVQERMSAPQTELFKDKIEQKTKTIGELVSLDELMAIYNESWIDEWFESPEQKEEYKSVGMRSLRDFYKHNSDKIINLVALEKPFSINLGEIAIRGTIDRIDRLEDGTLKVIDYKTGRSKDEDEVDKEQLLIYQMAVTELFGHPSALTYYYLQDGSEIIFLGNEDDLKALKQKINETIIKIKNSNFEATPSPQKCKFCDYKEICDFRQL